MKLVQNDYLKFKLANIGVYNSWWIYIHNELDTPSGYDWNAVEIKKSFYYSMGFTLNSYQLLERPYPTDCKNYNTNTVYLSRKDCIRKCKIKQSLDKCRVISYETDVYRDEPVVRFAETKDEIQCVKDLKLKRSCMKMCPNSDCYKQHFVPKIVSESNENYPDYTEMSLAITADPQVKNYHKPRIETVEFLCYMASTFSLWFGFTMISIYSRFHDLFKQTKLAIHKSKLKHSHFKSDKVFIIIKKY